MSSKVSRRIAGSSNRLARGPGDHDRLAGFGLSNVQQPRVCGQPRHAEHAQRVGERAERGIEPPHLLAVEGTDVAVEAAFAAAVAAAVRAGISPGLAADRDDFLRCSFNDD
jgi:hypothetical protein